MERKKFLTNIATIAAIGLIAPNSLFADNEDLAQPAEGRVGPFGTHYEDIANKYFNNTVKGFKTDAIVTHDSSHPKAVNRPVDRWDLQGAYMSKIIKGRKPTKLDIKEFCESINKCADTGLIEYGIMCNVCSIKLIGSDGLFSAYGFCPTSTEEYERHLLLFYSFTRYEITYLKEKGNKYFKQEGSIID